MQGLILIDVLVGARLQLNTLFGYTPTVAGWFAGIGNLAFAQISAGAVLLAGAGGLPRRGDGASRQPSAC